MPATISNIRGYLNRPYPFYYGSWDTILSILATVAVLSFSFSYFFEPFEVNREEHKISYVYICLIHALLPIFIAFVYFMFLDKTRIDDRQWTLGKEAFHLSILMILIGIGSFLVRDVIYDKPDNWSSRYFWEEIGNTFLVGILLLAVLLPLNLERLLKRYKTAAGQLKIQQTDIPLLKRITITSSIVSENFDIEVSDFIFAKAEGNYVEIYCQEKDVVTKRLVRLTLKELQKQLADFPFIFQTHRSYVINTGRIKSVKGNAQGYLLSFHQCAIEVPVSRSKIAEFNALFPQNA